MKNELRKFLFENGRKILAMGYIEFKPFINEVFPQLGVLNQFFKDNEIHLYLEQITPETRVGELIGCGINNNLEVSFYKGDGDDFRKFFSAFNIENLLECNDKYISLLDLIDSYYAESYQEFLYILADDGKEILDFLKNLEKEE